MNKLVEKFISKVGKCPFLHDLLMRPYQFFVLDKQVKKYKQSFDQHAIQVLKEFTEFMDQNGYPYVLFGGTMLGAIREHGFIKHDRDADTAMWIEDYNPKMVGDLEKIGFSLLNSYSVDNDKYAKELTFAHNKTGVRVDVYFFYPPINGLTKYPFHCDFIWYEGMDKTERIPRIIEYPITHERRKALFEGVEMWIPANAEELCEFRYGENYMIPDPTWNWKKEKNNVTDWMEMKSKTSVTHY